MTLHQHYNHQQTNTHSFFFHQTTFPSLSGSLKVLPQHFCRLLEHNFFTGQTPFLLPNQQHQSTMGKSPINWCKQLTNNSDTPEDMECCRWLSCSRAQMCPPRWVGVLLTHGSNFDRKSFLLQPNIGVPAGVEFLLKFIRCKFAALTAAPCCN